MLAVAVTLHALAAVFWVGGMAFAYTALRPAAGGLEPPERLLLWNRVFARFFPGVWVSVVVLPMSGYHLVFAQYGGLDAAPMAVHAMQGLGWVMIALYLFLQFGPYRTFKAAVARTEWPIAAAALNRIRQIVGINLLVGVVVVAAGASARYL